MELTLLYFDDCPHWRAADAHLRAIERERPDVQVIRHIVDTPEEAERTGFRGSPSILVDGVDPFAAPDAPVGLSCRVYQTPDGPAGSPTLAQIQNVLSDTAAGGLRPVEGGRADRPGARARRRRGESTPRR